MKPRFIYFDLDNTLLDHNKAESRAQQVIYDTFPVLQNVTKEKWLETYQLNNHNLWVQYQDGEIDRFQLHRLRFKNTMTELNLSVADSEEIGITYMKKYREFWDWVDGAREALSNIVDRYEVGIITNGFKETQIKKFDQMKLGNYFESMIISEELGELKPHPKVFDHATEKAGVPRENILYVGDSYSSDIIGGKNAGWKTAWYTPSDLIVEEDQTADFRFEQFDDLVELLS